MDSKRNKIMVGDETMTKGEIEKHRLEMWLETAEAFTVRLQL